MNVPTIQMPKKDALKKLAGYRHQLHLRADAEYEAAAKGYAALAKGAVLLDLAEVFAECPRDHKERPMLAIARADRRQVQFNWSGPGTYVFDTTGRWSGRGHRMLIVRVPSGAPRDRQRQPNDWEGRGHALVPMVPADVRPRHALNKCHVLWEVPEWADNRIGAVPHDPYLLQHLAGSLWVVLAEWDLTPLEQAITRGRIDA